MITERTPVLKRKAKEEGETLSSGRIETKCKFESKRDSHVAPFESKRDSHVSKNFVNTSASREKRTEISEEREACDQELARSD